MQDSFQLNPAFPTTGKNDERKLRRKLRRRRTKSEESKSEESDNVNIRKRSGVRHNDKPGPRKRSGKRSGVRVQRNFKNWIKRKNSISGKSQKSGRKRDYNNWVSLCLFICVKSGFFEIFGDQISTWIVILGPDSQSNLDF